MYLIQPSSPLWIAGYGPAGITKMHGHAGQECPNEFLRQPMQLPWKYSSRDKNSNMTSLTKTGYWHQSRVYYIVVLSLGVKWATVRWGGHIPVYQQRLPGRGRASVMPS